jgi:hypothetical protein
MNRILVTKCRYGLKYQFRESQCGGSEGGPRGPHEGEEAEDLMERKGEGGGEEGGEESEAARGRGGEAVQVGHCSAPMLFMHISRLHSRHFYRARTLAASSESSPYEVLPE